EFRSTDPSLGHATQARHAQARRGGAARRGGRRAGEL
ncbi:MAG: hypothetical protein AVDCRST_MAG30-887, partial [uncultured Solirubrobacteraceae bacterium]